MPTIYSTEHEVFRHSLRRFLDKELVKPYERFNTKDGVDEFWRKAGDAGLLGSCFAPEYGGAGGDFVFNVIIGEEVGRSVGSAYVGSVIMSDLTSHILNRFGTDEQKALYAPGMISGEIHAAMPLTEPSGGSDVAAIKTVAIREGDEYVINGSKAFISNGAYAKLLFLAAKTDPAKGASGISLILVPADTPGVVQQKMALIGWPMGDTGQLFFTDVRVPASNLLGQERKGMEMLMSILMQDRLQVGSRCQGAVELALDLTLDYVKHRKAFGQRVLDFQNTQFVLAEIRTDIEAGRAFLDQCMMKLQEGTLTMAGATMLKLWMSEMEGRVMDKCLQLFGGAGLLEDTPISRMYTAARVQRIYSGTSEMQKVGIARSLS
jgi:alkylation response protein AidB-like acyl-CoA dehydrogenase